MGRAFPIAWRRSPVRRRPLGSALVREGLLQRPARRRPAVRDAYRAHARRVELRSKIRDRRYLERAIRYLAQILIDGTSRKPRR
jgi:hypothetical protein